MTENRNAVGMTFRSGSVSYSRFRITGSPPQQVDDELLEAIASHTVKPPSVGAPPQTQAGWCAGQHVFDTDFSRDAVVFGSMLVFGMRIDTNRVPADVRKAYRLMAESAQQQDSPTGYLNRAEKQAARDEAEQRCQQELAEGRYRTSKMVPIVWDLARQVVFAPAFSDVKVSAMNDLFRSTFDCSLQPLSAGAAALDIASRKGLTREYDDAKPSSFTSPPAAVAAGDDANAVTRNVIPAEAGPQSMCVPWSHAGPEPSDFLGNEFLIWLWYHCAVMEGMIDLPNQSSNGSPGNPPISLLIDRVLDMDCAWEITGKQMLRADGPHRLPEAYKALQHGKWPRKMGLMLAARHQQWSFTLQGDQFIVSGLKLPKPDDEDQQKPTSVREEIEDRLVALSEFDQTLLQLYSAFLTERMSDRWHGRRDSIRQWISHGRRPARHVRDNAQPATIETVPQNGVVSAAGV